MTDRPAPLGRPPILGGRPHYLSVRLPGDLMDRLDAHAESVGQSRSEAVRAIIALAVRWHPTPTPATLSAPAGSSLPPDPRR